MEYLVPLCWKMQLLKLGSFFPSFYILKEVVKEVRGQPVREQLHKFKKWHFQIIFMYTLPSPKNSRAAKIFIGKHFQYLFLHKN